MLRFFRISIVEPWISRDWSFLRRQESGFVFQFLFANRDPRRRGDDKGRGG